MKTYYIEITETRTQTVEVHTVELFSTVPQQAYSALANWLRLYSKTKKTKSVFTELLKSQIRSVFVNLSNNQ